ncbi:MAG TPA: hypothetical protein VGB77_16990 [Abditibacteriaceae bacterium]|jgi:hypothetical protein
MHENPCAVLLLRRIRFLIGGFVIGLVLSGLTAFPLTWELNLLASWLGAGEAATPGQFSGVTEWIVRVRNALNETDGKYPFLAYGYDWLAFAHLVIALAFIGPWRDPVRNIWVIEWAMLCCIAILPLAFICGPIRGIPFYWQLIDCSFGVVGILPLWWCRQLIGRFEDVSVSTATTAPFAQKQPAGQAG